MYGKTQTKIAVQALSNNNLGLLIEAEGQPCWLRLFCILIFEKSIHTGVNICVRVPLKEVRYAAIQFIPASDYSNITK